MRCSRCAPVPRPPSGPARSNHATTHAHGHVLPAPERAPTLPSPACFPQRRLARTPWPTSAATLPTALSSTRRVAARRCLQRCAHAPPLPPARHYAPATPRSCRSPRLPRLASAMPSTHTTALACHCVPVRLAARAWPHHTVHAELHLTMPPSCEPHVPEHPGRPPVPVRRLLPAPSLSPPAYKRASNPLFTPPPRFPANSPSLPCFQCRSCHLSPATVEPPPQTTSAQGKERNGTTSAPLHFHPLPGRHHALMPPLPNRPPPSISSRDVYVSRKKKGWFCIFAPLFIPFHILTLPSLSLPFS